LSVELKIRGLRNTIVIHIYLSVQKEDGWEAVMAMWPLLSTSSFVMRILLPRYLGDRCVQATTRYRFSPKATLCQGATMSATSEGSLFSFYRKDF